jgi:hypothetical protein
VPDVLVMPAFKLSNPMFFFVLMKADDAAFDSHHANRRTATWQSTILMRNVSHAQRCSGEALA